MVLTIGRPSPIDSWCLNRDEDPARRRKGGSGLALARPLFACNYKSTVSAKRTSIASRSCHSDAVWSAYSCVMISRNNVYIPPSVGDKTGTVSEYRSSNQDFCLPLHSFRMREKRRRGGWGPSPVPGGPDRNRTLENSLPIIYLHWCLSASWISWLGKSLRR